MAWCQVWSLLAMNQTATKCPIRVSSAFHQWPNSLVSSSMATNIPTLEHGGIQGDGQQFWIFLATDKALMEHG
jgi:hypothetical protein